MRMRWVTFVVCGTLCILLTSLHGDCAFNDEEEWWGYARDVIRRIHPDRPHLLSEPRMKILSSIERLYDYKDDGSVDLFVFPPSQTHRGDGTPLVSFVSSLEYLFAKNYTSSLATHNFFCRQWGNCTHYLYMLPHHPMLQKLLVVPLFFTHFGRIHSSVLYTDLDAVVRYRTFQHDDKPHMLAYDALLGDGTSSAQFVFQGGKWPNGGILGFRNKAWLGSFWSEVLRRYLQTFWNQTEPAGLLLDQFAIHAELIREAEKHAHNTKTTWKFAGWKEKLGQCTSPKSIVACDLPFLDFMLERFADNSFVDFLRDPCRDAVLASCPHVVQTPHAKACDLQDKSFFGPYIRCLSPIPRNWQQPTDLTSALKEYPFQYVHLGGYDLSAADHALFFHTGSRYFNPAGVAAEIALFQTLRQETNASSFTPIHPSPLHH